MRLFGRKPLNADAADMRSRAEQRRADRGADARKQRWRRNNALPSLVAALDVGTHKTICLIARRERSRLRVIGIGHQQSRGVKAGVVVDSAAVEQTVLNAVHQAEQSAGQSISSIAIAFSGGRASSRLIQSKLTLSGARVGHSHMRKLSAQAVSSAIGAEQTAAATLNRQLISCEPVDYAVDFERSIQDPRGLFADELSGHYHAVSMQSGAIKTVCACIERNLLSVEQLFFAPLCAAEAAVSDEEAQLGCLIIDLGAGTTSYTLISGGAAVYTGSIPLGGDHITRDLSQAYAISQGAAERLKTMDGAALSFARGDNDAEQTLMMGQASDIAFEDRLTSTAELVGYIRPRCEEIFEMVKERLDVPELQRFAPRRVVLTGGAAALLGIDRLASEILSLEVRVGANQGAARSVLGLPEDYQGTAFAVTLGALTKAAGLEASGRTADLAGGTAEHPHPTELGFQAQAQLHNPASATPPPAHPGKQIGSWLRTYF